MAKLVVIGSNGRAESGCGDAESLSFVLQGLDLGRERVILGEKKQKIV